MCHGSHKQNVLNKITDDFYGDNYKCHNKIILTKIWHKR